MEESAKRIRKVSEAIERQFALPPSVIAWKRMADLLSEYVTIAIQLRDVNMHHSQEFCKGIGYLMLAPKRVPVGMLLDDKELDAINYYTGDEIEKMLQGYGRLVLRMGEWSAFCGGDEPGEADEGRQPFHRVVWRFYQSYDRKEMQIFKTPIAKTMFRAYPFEWLVEHGQIRVQRPAENVESVLPMGKKEDVYLEETLECLRRTAAATEMIAGDAIAEGQARRRVGTPGEIEQENEVVRRTRANDGKGLRGFVVSVLNNRQWQFRDGYGTDPASIARCYNRCYSLLHPARRRIHR